MFLKMPSGGQMPANGIGMCCRPAAYDPESVRRAVLWYLLQGGRHIDTADAYWNHNTIGEAMKIAEQRGIPRSEIFLTTKIMPSYFGTESTNATVHRFIKELGVDYIDLVLMHAPSFPIGRFGECKERPWKDCRTDTWNVLSALRDQGLVRDVGVSNFAKKHLQEIASLDKAPIAANQFEFHPWAADWQFDAFKYCNEHSIAVTAYYSLGGFLSKAQTETVQTMNDITKSTGKSTQQVLLRWALQKNVSVIPGTSNPKHMKENLDLYSWKLAEEDMARLDKLRSDPNRIKFFGLEEDQS
jgi:diketogulonate reductase-like aldo/keto reductase